MSVEGLAAASTHREAAVNDPPEAGYSFPLSCLENAGKMDIQLNANVEDQDRAKCGKNEAGGMKSFVCRLRKSEAFRADKRYLMVERMLAVLPSLTTLMM